MLINLKELSKTEKARLAGSVYFLLLGLVNFVATLIYAEIRSFDLILVLVSLLPILIRKKIFLLIFGIVAAFISIYGLLAALSFSLDQQVQTTKMSFLMGFLLLGSALFAALLLVFAAYSDEKPAPHLVD